MTSQLPGPPIAEVSVEPSSEVSGAQRSFAGTTRFDIVSLLGRGANGIVYRALDRETGRELALKTLSSPDAEQSYHLKAEFRSLAQITHPHLVQLEELFVSSDECYFTMELVGGTTFAEFVRELHGEAEAWSEDSLARLCDVTAQLVSGIAALHAAGKLHRDIKPSNILVTPDGRGVLVDFGLCTELRLMDRARHHLVGTLLYMAPEQAWGKPLTPAADWYALGAVLYEALAGRLPFAGGAASRILFDKEKPAPVPADGGALAEIAAALLHPDPTRRPSPAAILDATRMGVPPSSPASSEEEAIPRSHEQLSPRPPPFVGRGAEMSVLDAALDEVVRGRPAVVDVQGASGMGKTELVERFVASVSRRSGAVVLRGRCHPQESVSYNGFDGIIDDLSEWLRNLADSALGDVMPVDVAALYALFPVLGRIPAIARTAHAEGTEPYAMRQRAFRALRELLAKIGELYTMVVTIDDLQWGGADTAALLTEVFRAPHMPRSLLVLSYRSEDHPSSTLLGVLREQASDLLDSVHQIVLGPMDHSASCELAAHLLGDSAPALRAAGERIAREAMGHPFYLRELALAASEPSSPTAATPTHEPASAPSELRVLLRDRIDRLEREDRRLLELAAVGGRPLPRRIILAAAGPGERSRHLVMRLARQRLLRETVVAGEPAVEPYHSHVREAVLAAVADGVRQSCHRALADTLLREPDPDVDSLVDHLLGAGDRAAAGRFAETAAERADSALAFERAVQLYRLAVELAPAPGGARSVRRPRSALRTRLAAALANAGRSREAADVYAAASHDAASDSPEVQADLARRAAEHYLRAGDLAEGFARMRRVLADVSISYPASPASAVATMIGLRARLALRGLELERRPPEARGPAQLARVDACWSAGLGHAWVDPIRAAAFQARYMMLALDTGEPTRVARGLATEASQLAAAGGTARTVRARDLLTRAERMTESTDDRDAHAFAQLMAGTVEFYASRYREALSLCAKAETILRERQSRSEWELMTSHVLSLASLAYLGDLRTLRARQTELLAEARQRGNILAAICLASGVANIRWLAADDPDEAQRRADESLAPWKEDDFRFPQYLHLLACVNISLYRGDAAAAWRRIVREWPRVISSMSFQVQNFRVTLRHLRARCALAVVTSGVESAPSWPKREALLFVARRDARHLAEEDVGWASSLAHSLHAGLAAATGDPSTAIAELAKAAQAYRDVGMMLHAAAADHERSRLLGGEDGRALLRSAEASMIAEQVSRSERLAAMLVPGITA
jgi:serine/threonine protein kinase/tetratricopeptide (TPR) repeat protein